MGKETVPSGGYNGHFQSLLKPIYQIKPIPLTPVSPVYTEDASVELKSASPLNL